MRQLFVGTLSSAENLENQLEDSVNYLLAQTVLFEESENVADKLQESLKKLCRFLAARLKLADATRCVLEIGLGIIGVTAPEKM